MNEQEQDTDLLDPIDQALALAAMLSRGERVGQTDNDDERFIDDTEMFADDRTLVLAAGQIAIAHHLRRVADALERLVNIQWNRP